MSLSKTLYLLLSTGLTHEDRILSKHDQKIVDWDVKHQHKQKDLGPELQCLLKVKQDLSKVLIFEHAILNAK